ncbi:flavodoxin FldA [Campylobacter geochelonis]|uniref:flavodoxin FldA n=1 Tax=Campylobacter geochelonis TaxID=1780362 RepID=UPI00077080D3|nr:flavodoxin FldA [Campylobacter geochelonis]CZE49002.1 flavodoxin FldA [Campylobacter geochelonis]
MSIAIVYGSSMGNTENAAGVIKEKLGLEADVLNIADTDASTLNGYDKLICGTSTWGSGDLQDDWDAFDFSALNLDGKTVAVFGLGDSQSYSDEYCNAMGKLYYSLKEKGATMVGEVSKDGYTFEDSEAINDDGNFVGLALDYDNEDDMSDERISNWVEKIRPYFA